MRACLERSSELCRELRPQALFFYHTKKVGLAIGVKWGRGFLLVRTNGRDEVPATFSQPVFYKVKEGSFGLTAGLARAAHASIV